MKKGLQTAQAHTLESLFSYVSEPLSRVEAELRSSFSDATPEAQRVAMHLVEGGGKRVRPILSLLTAEVFGSRAEAAIPIAVAAEMIHMATLVHDDVIDAAATRRGQRTVNTVWDGRTSVLAGDAMLARSLVILVDQGRPEPVRIFSDMLYRMCEGEISQNASLFDVDQDESDYFRRIEKKTALFFAACCQAAAVVCGASEAQSIAMRAYGRHIGMAFQVIDDLLDVTADEAAIGKPVGSDLAAGNLTLPVLYTLRTQGNRDLRARIQAGRLTADDVDHVLELVRSNGALEYSRSVAREFIRHALDELIELPDAEPVDRLRGLAELVIDRTA